MSGRMRAAERPAALLSGGPGALGAGFFVAGLTALTIGLVMPPRDALFWVALCFLPVCLGGVTTVLAMLLGERLDAVLTGAGARAAFPPQAAASLPESARATLHTAALPALLAELVGRAVPDDARAAAGRLAGAFTTAWNIAPDDTARAALARDLPALVAGLLAGGDAGIRAAEEAAARLGGGPR
jgi:hypothetical protein